MAYTSADGRQQLLDTLAEAIEEIGGALAALGAAYEELDERSADELEEQLFRPVQSAYGRARRTYTEFAARNGHEARTFTPPPPGSRSLGARGYIDDAVAAIAAADDVLATLQDSLLPVEIGDPEVRAGLSEVRETLDHLARRAREVVRTLGR